MALMMILMMTPQPRPGRALGVNERDAWDGARAQCDGGRRRARRTGAWVRNRGERANGEHGGDV